MTRVVFYEKPGCINNTRQKKLLRGLGHELIERDLLTEMWTVGRLAEFFDGMPLAEWFNPSAPSIKSGSIDPGSLSEKAALALMVKEPLLIRRPLMDTPFGLSVGFDDGPVLRALGVQLEPDVDLQTCVRTDIDQGCIPDGGVT